MYTYKSFPTYPHNHKHENDFKKKFSLATVSKFSIRMMTSELNNGRSKTGVVNMSTPPQVFVFDVEQKLESRLFDNRKVRFIKIGEKNPRNLSFRSGHCHP